MKEKEEDKCVRCGRTKFKIPNRIFTSLMISKCLHCGYERIMKYNAEVI